MMESRGYAISPQERRFITNPLVDPNDMQLAIRADLSTLGQQYAAREQSNRILLNEFKAVYGFVEPYTPKLLTGSYALTEGSYLDSNNIKKQAYVYYTPFARVLNGVKKADDIIFNDLVELLKKPNILETYDKLIIISDVNPTTQQLKRVQNLISLHPEVFVQTELLVHPTEHFLAEKVSMSEAPTSTKKEELPKLLHDNIIAKFYGYGRGQVIKFDKKPIVATGFEPLAQYRVVK